MRAAQRGDVLATVFMVFSRADMQSPLPGSGDPGGLLRGEAIRA
jgi:hypothetical protein